MQENLQNKKRANLVRIIAKESIRGTGSRLVLGERDICIQDALDKGGVFIDFGPEVLKILVQGNIDPYLIYEEAFCIEIESRIPTIDSVCVNVNG